MPMLGTRQQRVAMGISEEVIRESRARLYPSITNPNWLILRRRREIFKHWLHDLRISPVRVLDVGGRLQPYRKLLADDVCYIAVDIRTTPLVDVVGRGEQLPFASGSFDLVLCTQVLQYVPEPSLVLSEINRVLKPEGALILSVPAPMCGIQRRSAGGFFLRVYANSSLPLRRFRSYPKEAPSLGSFALSMYVSASSRDMRQLGS
jgi:SAM-dependent methyltransferase